MARLAWLGQTSSMQRRREENRARGGVLFKRGKGPPYRPQTMGNVAVLRDREPSSCLYLCTSLSSVLVWEQRVAEWGDPSIDSAVVP